MAIDTAVLLKFACAGLHFSGIVETGRWLIVRMANDRIGADLDQRPLDNSGVLLGAGNTVKAADEKDRGGDGEDNCKRTDCC